LGANDARKFDYIYGGNNQPSSMSIKGKDAEVSEFEEVEEDPTDMHEKMGIELEDIHDA